jgi:hypothetical protein
MPLGLYFFFVNTTNLLKTNHVSLGISISIKNEMFSISSEAIHIYIYVCVCVCSLDYLKFMASSKLYISVIQKIT